MASIRMMNRPEDYEAIGVSPDHVEAWEDGRRNSDAPGCVEWWYFDAETDDGITVNVNFATNPPTMRSAESGYHPFVFYNVQFADGTCETNVIQVDASDCSLGEDACDVRMGRNYFRGDLSSYDLHVENSGGDVTIDLHLCISQAQLIHSAREPPSSSGRMEMCSRGCVPFRAAKYPVRSCAEGRLSGCTDAATMTISGAPQRTRSSGTAGCGAVSK